MSCKQRGIPVIASTGAGGKVDPTRIRIARDCRHMDDPLARAVRRRLQEHPQGGGEVTMVISTEPPRAGLLPVQDGEQVAPESMLDYQVVPNFRVRTIPVLGTTPAIFGMAAAAHVICEIAGFRMFPEPVFGIREGVWTSQLAALCERLVLGGADLHADLDINEVEVCMCALFVL